MGDLFERSPWSLLGSNIKRDRPIRGFQSNRPIRGVYIRVTTSQRDPILPAVHTYMNTRIHTHHTCLHMCELVRCSGICRREQKTEGEETRDREWKLLINDYIHMYSIFNASFHPTFVFGVKAPTSGGHPRPLPQRNAAI